MSYNLYFNVKLQYQILPHFNNKIKDPNNLDEGSATVFTSDFEGQVTFYVENYSSGSCWVWGAEPDYYADLGCTIVD